MVFGAGKWIASLPTGYLLGRLGRPLMIWGLLLIALIDVASVMTLIYTVFLEPARAGRSRLGPVRDVPNKNSCLKIDV